MQMQEDTGTVSLRRTIAIEGYNPIPAATGYGMNPTGEAFETVARRSAASSGQAKKRSTHTRQTPESRAASRMAWKAARTAATGLVAAIESDALESRFIAADDLERALAKLWSMRGGFDDVWQMILNHLQGMMRQLFMEKLVEALNSRQGAAIRDIVERHLGPATKTVDDLNEVVRLITDAGGDPYYAISGDPEEEKDS